MRAPRLKAFAHLTREAGNPFLPRWPAVEIVGACSSVGANQPSNPWGLSPELHRAQAITECHPFISWLCLLGLISLYTFLLSLRYIIKKSQNKTDISSKKYPLRSLHTSPRCIKKQTLANTRGKAQRLTFYNGPQRSCFYKTGCERHGCQR